MKAMNVIIKILAALATVAGVVYIVATYGEQIVAWAKKILNNMPKCPACEEEDPEIETEVEVEEAAEEVAAEELRFTVDERSLSTLKKHVNLFNYGKDLIQESNASLTPYGLVQRRDGQPMQSIEHGGNVNMTMN